MRNLLSIAAFALLAGTTAQAASITDPAADVGLWFGDIVAQSSAPVSTDIDASYVFLSGGPGMTYALELDYGSDFLFAETDSYTYDGSMLSFLFDLAGDPTFGDWIQVTYTFGETIADPFAADIDRTLNAAMAVTWADAAVPAVPLPATLPLLLCAFGAGAALLRRKA